jgi:membrane-associated protease RseP (regulator of RpoE activity)
MTDRLAIYARLKNVLADVMQISSYEFHGDAGISLRGQLLRPAAQAAKDIKAYLAEAGYIGELQPNAGGHMLFVVPAPAPTAQQPQRTIDITPQMSLVAFILTAISVAFTGATNLAPPNPTLLEAVQFGLLFMLATLAVLGAHEMGHFIVARMRGEKVTWPLFIPFPIVTIGGTMGAVIIQKTPYKNRRHLLEIGIAGPLAGFIIAVPLLLIGLALTSPETRPVVYDPNNAFLGESLLTRTLGMMFFGDVYMSTAVTLSVHPFVLGAWFGLLVTGINLIPAGQLDGGHIAYALLGERARYVTYATIGGMILMTAFVSPSWGLWTLLLTLFARSHPPVDEPQTPLAAGHYLLAIAGFLLLLLTFVPRPLFQLTP